MDIATITPTYDRTNLAEVLAEYTRQSTLPPVILSPSKMREAAIEAISSKRAEGSAY